MSIQRYNLEQLFIKTLRQQIEEMIEDKTKQQPKKYATGRWTQEQHLRFMQAIMIHSNNWKKVEQAVGTRSGSQVRSHAQKFFIKLKKQEDAKKNSGSNQLMNQMQQQYPGEQQGSENHCTHLLKGEFSNITPPQGISQIFKDQTKQGSQINIYEMKNQLTQKMKSIQSQEKQKQLGEKQQQKTQKKVQKQKTQQPAKYIKKPEINQLRNFANLLQVIQSTNGDDKKPGELVENQSFLLAIIKKYKDLLVNTNNITNLIDYGKQEVQHYENSVRKRSFELPEGIQGSEQDLNERKKRVLTESCTSKMTQQQVQSWKQKINEHHHPEIQQRQSKNTQMQRYEQNKQNSDQQKKGN